MTRATWLARTMLVAAVLVTACGTEPEVVILGGATPGTVERPWGTVKTFPQAQKAQKPTSTDTTFITQMIAHHEQAVELSELVLAHVDIDERVTAAARFIALDQAREIDTMHLWLTAWSVKVTADQHVHHMPGMVAADKVRRLGRLKPDEAQREFVDLMIFHHQGAVAMSQELLSQSTHDFTNAVARHLIREQGVEIRYLEDLATTPLLISLGCSSQSNSISVTFLAPQVSTVLPSGGDLVAPRTRPVTRFVGWPTSLRPPREALGPERCR